MAGFLERLSSSEVVERSTPYLPWRVQRALTALRHETIMRVARVQADARVLEAKLDEVDNLSRDAMQGHALLTYSKNILAGPDPILNDSLQSYVDLSQHARLDLIASQVKVWSREVGS